MTQHLLSPNSPLFFLPVLLIFSTSQVNDAGGRNDACSPLDRRRLLRSCCRRRFVPLLPDLRPTALDSSSPTAPGARSDRTPTVLVVTHGFGRARRRRPSGSARRWRIGLWGRRIELGGGESGSRLESYGRPPWQWRPGRSVRCEGGARPWQCGGWDRRPRRGAAGETGGRGGVLCVAVVRRDRQGEAALHRGTRANRPTNE
jgi:hypothetical protein